MELKLCIFIRTKIILHVSKLFQILISIYIKLHTAEAPSATDYKFCGVYRKQPLKKGFFEMTFKGAKPISYRLDLIFGIVVRF